MKRNRMLRTFILTTFAFVGILCAQTFAPVHQKSIALASADVPEVWITVFVHGIMSIQPHVSISNMVRLLHDSIENSHYQDTVELMRHDPFFHQNQAMQGLGLLKINPFDVVCGNASGALAIAMNFMECKAGFSTRENHYYTYGWSGLLSYKNRYKTAIHFFRELEHLMNNFKQRGKNPKVRIIGYSHGGNVCLGLGRVAEEHFPDSPLQVDELVIIATPIQRETDYLINTSFFGKIYNLFSLKDRVQKLDFFNRSRFFSSNIFKERKCFPLPNKLVQVELRVTRLRKDIIPPLSTCDPKCPENRKRKQHFQMAGDFCKKSIMLGKNRLLRDVSPGHGEVWFFNWTPRYYRSYFPLRPLPMITLFPFIERHLQTHQPPEHPSQLLMVDVRPEYGTILFKERSRRTTKLCSATSFLHPHELEEFGCEIKKFAPQEYTPAQYKKHVQKAVQEAKEARMQKNQKRGRRRCCRSTSSIK